MKPEDAAIWEQMFRDHADEFRAAPVTPHQQDCLEFLKQIRGVRVLDIGCGIGRWAVLLAREGFEVTGFDLSPTAIRVARQWAADESLEIDFRESSIDDIVFDDGQFDAVVAAMVLDNLPAELMVETLARIRGWLAAGGHFYALFNPHLTPEQVRELAATPNPSAGIDTQYYSEQQLRNYLGDFDVVQTRTYDEGVRAFFMRR